MTVEFRVLPVDEAVVWIRVWTDHHWPISLQEAFLIRDMLGWVPAPDDGRFFVTKLSVSGDEDGRIYRVDNRGGIKGLEIPLSSRVSRQDSAITAPLSRKAYDSYVQALASAWGGGPKNNSRTGYGEHQWILRNGVTATIGGLDTSVSVFIDSPAITQMCAEEAYYEAEGYLTPGTLDAP